MFLTKYLQVWPFWILGELQQSVLRPKFRNFTVYIFSQEYPGDELLIMYDYDFKYGQNFYIFMTEESKEKALSVG